MLLGEALADRASKKKQLEQVEARAASVARFQEGEQPAENADELLDQGRRLIGELRDLARRINRTNSMTELDPGFTLTDALAERDGYAAQYRLVTAIADAGAGGVGRGIGWGRQLRSELQQVSAVPVADLRAEADQIAEARRRLDVRIQQAGWSTELLD
jgi:DNA repair exonuclease SbcCD ATPase subunit